MAWYRNDKAVVTEALKRGERPDLATTMASGPLDELVAFHEELGIFGILDKLEVQRERAGVSDELLLHTLATLPFVEAASLSGASEVLFREPAVLLQLGWAPVQIRQGSNGRHRHPEGRQEESLPCHPDTLRDAALARGGVRVGACASRRGAVALSAAVGARQGLRRRWQRVGRRFPCGGPGVCFSHPSDHRGLATVAWAVLGERQRSGGDTLADGRLLDWTHHRYVRTIQGHKQVRGVEVTAAGALTSWEGFTEAAARYGRADASLWACLIHDVTTPDLAAEPPRALVSTRSFADGFAARPRLSSTLAH